jgi:hypothetical protein
METTIANPRIEAMIAHVQNGMSLLVNIGMVMAKQGAIRKRK